jgi:hypothetical protein
VLEDPDLLERIRDGRVRVMVNSDDAEQTPGPEPEPYWGGTIGKFEGIPITASEAVPPGNLVFVDVEEMDRQLIEFMKQPIELHVCDPRPPEYFTQELLDNERDRQEALRRLIQIVVS